MSNIIIDSFRFGSASPVTPSLGYGLLYNWFAATDARGVAPSGFRVIGDAEITFLDTVTLSNLKGARNSISDERPYWLIGFQGDDLLMFKAYPAGVRQPNGVYQLFGSDINQRLVIIGADTISGQANYYAISATFKTRFTYAYTAGGSIRCVSDTEPATTLVQDADGNSYSWVQIGSQYWLQQSLRTTKYNNGDSIPTGLDNAAWAATTDGAWAYPNGDSNLPI